MDREKTKKIIIYIIIPFALILLISFMIVFGIINCVNERNFHRVTKYTNVKMYWVDHKGRVFTLDEQNPELNVFYYPFEPYEYNGEMKWASTIYTVEAKNSKTGDVEKKEKAFSFITYYTGQQIKEIEEFGVKFKINITIKENREEYIIKLFNSNVNATSKTEGIKEGFYYDELTQTSYRSFTVSETVIYKIKMQLQTLDGEVVKGELTLNNSTCDLEKIDLPYQEVQKLENEQWVTCGSPSEMGCYKIKIAIVLGYITEDPIYLHNETIILNIV